MNNLVRILAIFGLVLGAACERSSALVLPEGDIERGQELFVDLQCTSCHRVQGLELPEPESGRQFSHMIGSGMKVKTYSELVTSVINPSHKLAPQYRFRRADSGDISPMTVYNDVITVTELVDLVAFLETRYEFKSVPRYHYVPYGSVD